MIGLSGKPPGGGLSPVWPGPGTNGEVLGTTAGDEAADELLDVVSGADDVVSGADELLGGADDVVSGADEVVSGADELLGGTDELLGGTDELLGGTDALVGGADDVLGVPHGPWLRLNWPDHPL
jgi:putative membrane protein